MRGAPFRIDGRGTPYSHTGRGIRFRRSSRVRRRPGPFAGAGPNDFTRGRTPPSRSSIRSEGNVSAGPDRAGTNYRDRSGFDGSRRPKARRRVKALERLLSTFRQFELPRHRDHACLRLLIRDLPHGKFLQQAHPWCRKCTGTREVSGSSQDSTPVSPLLSPSPLGRTLM